VAGADHDDVRGNSMDKTPFNHRRLRDWWFRNHAAPDIGIEDASTIGHGPFNTHDLQSFLGRFGVSVFVPDSYTEVLLLGRDGYSERELLSLLRKRSGSTLRVYTQEMFLAYLSSGHDPLELPQVALLMGSGHPGVQALRALNFAWPTVDVRGFGAARSDHHVWRSEGYLRAIGYRVGSRGGEDADRRRVLVRAYGARVPARFGEDYAAYWGNPRTSARLERMARTIARQFRLGLARRTVDNALALTDWYSDLNWLKRKYYDGRCRFRWPSIDVG
jgi:hypothetical protein